MCTVKNFIKGRKWDRAKLGSETPCLNLKNLALQLCRICFCSFLPSLGKGNLHCVFVCFLFYLVLFIFIRNTKRLPQNSLKKKSGMGMVCGENNITCASELNFLVESKFSCRIRTRNKQRKKSLVKCCGCTRRRKENYREVLAHNSNLLLVKQWPNFDPDGVLTVITCTYATVIAAALTAILEETWVVLC